MCFPQPVCKMKHRVAATLPMLQCNHPLSPLNCCYLTLLWFIIIIPTTHTHTHLHILIHTQTHTYSSWCAVQCSSAVVQSLLLLLLIPASRLPEAHNAARWLNVIVFSSESLLPLNHSLLKVLSRKRNKDSLFWLSSQNSLGPNLSGRCPQRKSITPCEKCIFFSFLIIP